MVGYRAVAFNLEYEVTHVSFQDFNIIWLMVENFILGIFPFPVRIAGQGWIGYAGTHVPMFVHKLVLIKPRQT